MNILIPALGTIFASALLGSYLALEIGKDKVQPDVTEGEKPRGPQQPTDVDKAPREGMMGLDDTEGTRQQPVQLEHHEWLRPEFFMVGTDFFDNMYSRKNINEENSEWAEFNYVPIIDKTNNIETQNLLSNEIRFSEPMFLPKYVPPVKPPSKRARILTRSVMSDQIQLDQAYANKFDGAVNITDNLSYVEPNNPFDRNWKDNILYHPDGSIM